MRWAEVETFAGQLEAVRFSHRDGLRIWRVRNRLVARQLDPRTLAVRMTFDLRSVLVREFPDAFSVPRRFEKHMMVAIALGRAPRGPVEQALEEAWRLQRST